jgi:hypothetical protein
MGLRIAAVSSLLLIALGGCGGKGTSTVKYTAPPAPQPASGGPPWPAPPNAMALTRKAGLTPEKAEFLQYHVHAHLDIFVNGQPVPIPSGIGINIKDPGVKSFKESDGTTSYGGINLCNKPCISPLHTHSVDGVLHTETKTVQPNRLGQFFSEWGLRFDRNCLDGFCKPKAPIAVFVDGKLYTGDPRTIELSNGTEIAIVIGTPPSSIPSKF